MKQFIKFTLASVLGFVISGLILLFIFFIMLAVFISGISETSKEKKITLIKNNSVLYLNIEEPILDKKPDNPFAYFDFKNLKTKKILTLKEIIDNLKKAKKDDKIKGILLSISLNDNGYATLEELRNAILDFKKSGKFVYAYSNLMNLKDYYLLSAADKVFLNKSGIIIFKGLSVEMTFFKNMFDKLDIDMQLIRHGKYKSAGEPFVKNKMSDENRDQIRELINSIWYNIQNGIVKSRNLTTKQINNIANNVLIRTPNDAVKYGLVDSLLFYDQLIDFLKEKTGTDKTKDLSLISISKYNMYENKKHFDFTKNKIAIINAVGEIVMSKGNDNNIGTENIPQAIRDARKDSSVKAIVLRVNSPGGSALTSDIIWREIEITKKVKPVVVSMGNIAASGGYYISCPANKIYAQSNTVTGSIGVFAVIANTKGFFNNKLGINIDTVKTHKFSDLGSIYRPLSAEEKSIIQESIEFIYNDFISKVAKGRNLDVKYVDSIAQGRIWSGTDALKIGLVDNIGGLDSAITGAAKLAGIEKYKVKYFPIEKNPFKKLLKMNYYIKYSLLSYILDKKSLSYIKKIETLKKLHTYQMRIPYNIEIY